MISVIATENPLVATKLRKALAARGYECPITHVLPLEGAERAVQAFPRKPDLVLIVLPPDSARGVRLVQKLRSETQGRMVAVGPVSDARRMLEILRAGADDYLDEDADIHEQIAAPLERLTAQGSGPSGGAVVALVSASGGCGTSLLASNLAVLLGRRHERCGVFDLASRFGDLSALLNLAPRHSLAELCRHEEGLDQEMLQQSLATHESGAHVLAAPMSEDDARAVTMSGIDRILQLARRLFPWSLLDMGTMVTGRTALLQGCDKIFVPFRLDFTSLCNTRRLLDEWERRQFASDRIVPVGMRCDQAGELPRAKVAAILGRSIAGWIPDEPLTAMLSVNCGVPAVIESPKSPYAVAVQQLADTVWGRVASADPETPAGTEEGRKPLWAKFRILPRMAGVVL